MLHLIVMVLVATSGCLLGGAVAWLFAQWLGWPALAAVYGGSLIVVIAGVSAAIVSVGAEE